MDAVQTEKLKALALAASPAPWVSTEHSWSRIGVYAGTGQEAVAALDIYDEATEDNQDELRAIMAANAAFITACRKMVPELIAEVERLRADPLYSTRQDAERFRRAIALEDNAEALYAAVLSNAPDTTAIRAAFDAAVKKEKA